MSIKFSSAVETLVKVHNSWSDFRWVLLAATGLWVTGTASAVWSCVPLKTRVGFVLR